MADGIGWALLGVVLCLAAVILNKVQQLEHTIEAVRRRLDAVAEHLDVKREAVPPEVAGLLRAGRKIEAIKVYRAATGAGLAEAKEAVERMGLDLDNPRGPVVQP